MADRSVDLRQLQALVQQPREDLDVELKNWLNINPRDSASRADGAKLAKELLALANHGGGYIILGFDDKTCQPDDDRPRDMAMYSQDNVNNIVKHYAEPPFHCRLHMVIHSEFGMGFPVIEVPGGTVPIRAKADSPDGKRVKKDTYYIRRVGGESSPPQSGQEWQSLIGRCVKANRDSLLNSIRHVVLGPSEPRALEKTAVDRFWEWHDQSTDRISDLISEKFGSWEQSVYRYGHWSAAYMVLGDVREISARDMLGILRQVKRGETGWAMWWVPSREEIRPRSQDGKIECWINDQLADENPSYTDFWRVAPDGLTFLIRGYYEDGKDRSFSAGTLFGVYTPVWRVAECLLHARGLAMSIAFTPSEILVRFTWNGLRNRTLMSFSDPFRDALGKASQDTVSSEIFVAVDEIEDALPQLIKQITAPLYTAFDFYELSIEEIVQQLERFRGRG